MVSKGIEVNAPPKRASHNDWFSSSERRDLLPDQAGSESRAVRSWLSKLGLLHIAILYGLAIFTAELVTNLASPLVGTICHLLIFAWSVAHGASETRSRPSALWLSLSLVPLIRIVSLGLPLQAFPQEWWYLVTGVPLIAATITVIVVLGLSRQRIGLRLPLRGTWELTAVVGFSGIFIGFGEFALLGPTSTFGITEPSKLIAAAAILLIGTGLVEELIFRGILQATAIRVLRVGPAIVFVSALFALMHMGHGSVLNVVYLFAISVYFGIVRYRTGSLLGVVIAHTLANIVLFIFMSGNAA
jgi:uncharacterized protein